MTVPRDPPSDSSLLPPSMRADDSRTAPLAADMARRWHAGERVPAEEYLARHPDLWDQPEAAADLIYEEICLREEQGEKEVAAEVLARFPQWRAQLEVLLDCHHMLEPDLVAPRFPVVGEKWEGFELVAELGRGGLGRVFLATQPDLADRPVVLKLTPSRGEEHLSLARLQHTHVVPLYAVHDDPERNLRALCMPYFGGLTLARFLQELREVPPSRRAGSDFVAALDRAEEAVPIRCTVRGPARPQLARYSYVQAVCWLGACLADGLDYAHERGLLHLDLKPSNVLLAADGQPMLLDFHLAHEPISPDGEPPEWLGGTPGYMSPEQAAAVAALCEGRPVPAAVDEPSDVYSLGVVLYELLAGELPPRLGEQRLDRRNPAVSPGLARVVARCLRPDPRERYRSAKVLGADLHRHLKDLPLLGVGEGVRERWRKWRRHRPRALWVYAGCVVVVGALAAAAWTDSMYRLERVQSIQSAGKAQAEALRAEKASDAATNTLITKTLRPLVSLLRLCEGGQAPLGAQWDDDCRAAWEQRGRLTEWVKAGASTEKPEEVRSDLLDLAILWSGMRADRAPGDTGHGEALRVLDEAEALVGTSAALCRERQRHYEALGDMKRACAEGCRAEDLSVDTAWDHVALGRYLLRRGDLDRAGEEFERALVLEPQGLWPHFYAGLRAYRLGNYNDAVLDFTFCAALATSPREMAPFLYNRAKAQVAAGRHALALRDYSQAVQLDDSLANAYLNRGILYYWHFHRYREALDDLQRALDRGASKAVAHYNRALVYREQKQTGAAVMELQAALKADPQHKEARALLQSLR